MTDTNDPLGQRGWFGWKMRFKGLYSDAVKLFGLPPGGESWGNGFATQEEAEAACKARDAESYDIVQCEDGTFLGLIHYENGPKMPRPPAPEGAPTCRVCGCWEYAACWDDERGACWWVEPDLCSHCEGKADEG